MDNVVALVQSHGCVAQLTLRSSSDFTVLLLVPALTWPVSLLYRGALGFTVASTIVKQSTGRYL